MRNHRAPIHASKCDQVHSRVHHCKAELHLQLIDYWRHVSKIKIYHNCHIYSLSPVGFTLYIRALLGDDCKQPHHNHYRFQQSMFQGTTTARQQPHAGWNVERLTISIYMQILDCKIIIIFILWVIIITPIWLAASFATIIALSALASPRSIARWRRKTDEFSKHISFSLFSGGVDADFHCWLVITVGKGEDAFIADGNGSIKNDVLARITKPSKDD